MTKIRILFNVLEVLKTEDIFPKVKSLGIETISIFGNLGWEKLPDYFKTIAKEFPVRSEVSNGVNINLYHIPTYKGEAGWQDSLRKDAERTISSLAQLGINNYCWMIECNLYGYKWNPLVGKYVHGDRLIEHFNTFYDIAHSVNPNANVIIVPYPHPLINLNCGIHGWKDWWIKHGEKMKFDQVSLDAHVGVWIYAINKKSIYKRLVNSIKFLKERGYSVSYVEVGYPTVGFKPLTGLYGWGREKNQIDLLDTCYQALTDMQVPYLQICEFIDPASAQVYERFFGNKGKVPKFLGFIPVLEEAHWGVFKSNGAEKKVCEWIRKVTGIIPEKEVIL